MRICLLRASMREAPDETSPLSTLMSVSMFVSFCRSGFACSVVVFPVVLLVLCLLLVRSSGPKGLEVKAQLLGTLTRHQKGGSQKVKRSALGK